MSEEEAPTVTPKVHHYAYDVAYDAIGTMQSWSVRECSCETPWKHATLL